MDTNKHEFKSKMHFERLPNLLTIGKRSSIPLGVDANASYQDGSDLR